MSTVSLKVNVIVSVRKLNSVKLTRRGGLVS